MATRFGESEPLNEDEVHRLLTRIGELEIGGGHYATLGAVVEATGAELSFASRELQTIRANPVRVSMVIPPRVVAITPAHVFIWIILAVSLIPLLIAMVASAQSQSDTPKTTFSIPVADGDLIFTSPGDIKVRKRDGTERTPTADEEGRILSLAAATGEFNR